MQRGTGVVRGEFRGNRCHKRGHKGCRGAQKYERGCMGDRHAEGHQSEIQR